MSILAGPILACRYNVRDIGFVNLGDKSYYIFGYVSNATSKDTVTDIETIFLDEMLESNIIGHIVNIEQDTGHPAMEFVETFKLKTFPAFILVSPQKKTRLLQIDPAKLKTSLTSTINDILVSPLREKIKKQVAQCYGSILVIEGQDIQKNNAAIEAAKASVNTIAEHMDFLPKEIANPPTHFVLKRDDFPKEQILLWALGLKPDNIKDTHAVILYGRLRQLGPVISGDDVCEEVLTNFLSVIGADCECGLDREWMTGDLLPCRWERDFEIKLAQSLGFDPKHPMVRMEISHILRKTGYSPGMIPGPDSFSQVPFGYRELSVDFEEEPRMDPNTTEKSSEAKPEKKQADLDTTGTNGEMSTGFWTAKKSISIIIVLAAAVLLTGTVILSNSKKGES